MSDTTAATGSNVTITLEELRKKLRLFEDTHHSCPHSGPLSDYAAPQSIFGMPVLLAEPRLVPRIKLSDDAPVSDKFRREFNAWLVATFGTKDVSAIPPGRIYIMGQSLVMRPETLIKINGLTA